VCGKLRAAGIVKMSFGSSRITRDSRTGNAVALGDDLKAAATDCLKKAATLLGVGLHLYVRSGATTEEGSSVEVDPDSSRGNGQGKPAPTAEEPKRGGNGAGRITNKQLAAIFAIARDRHLSNADVRALAQERFEKTLDYLSKTEASQLIEHLLSL